MSRLTLPRLLPTCLVVVGLLLGLGRATTVLAALPGETPEEMDQRMEWWRTGKFGMFVHWGLYAIPAGEWKGEKVPGIGEWIMHRAKIPVPEYEPLQKQFNPVKYNPQQWVAAAKAAGMKYIVITSKHHDGFCLFDSKHTDWDIAGTPYGKDLLKPLAEACHEAGIKMCWYHSIMDWHHPDAKGDRFPKYEQYMKAQLEELLTNYGEIGVLWFDGEWIKEWDEPKGIALEKYLRELQPNLIVNNRVGKRKRGPGDFGTPEQRIPATGMPGWDWETCMTMNDTWGFKKDDHNWKSTEDLIHKLVDIVSKGGNFLLNVGPTAEGEIPQPSLQRLEEIGRWMDRNGQSIYGTTASPFKKLAWGRCTQKPGKLYLHVFDWPADGKLVVPGLGNRVGKASLLATGETLETARDGSNVVVNLPAKALDPIDTVVVLEIEGEPEVGAVAATQVEGGAIKLDARDAETHGSHIRYETGDGKDAIGFWTDPADYVTWILRIDEPGKFDVEITYACTPPGGSRYAVEVAGQKLETKTEPTGSWTQFETCKVGRLKLGADRHVLSVKAQSKAGEGVMNLKSIVLTPAK